ncbi:hypothetical protein KAFR_0D03120 [Kazachstania africana CBS 2517]|uniref:Protein KTI12 n=1 Tax=Kazachstania africana (strain ATCC 22294 / BCRC 22015 / CBS 2517 / CECT 1963 / NBRC 1671 / NRRL Y-8276) TaxID=1071382 RepID=H2AUB0_KAZAF|nr:hypothetical protein KAFR_0D03120 [Kazachstania africana CBS 2517]CCF57960.1 hypothetical protein KAFR_0D03120 [Kazachstania africana CBS 2517]
MPLILFTGYPSSGKTTKAKELISLLSTKTNKKIIYHSDDTLSISHQDYENSKDEKNLRSKITSVVKRDLSTNNIVIIDSLNYIKGFRYQLHCEAKNMSTPFALIHIMCPVDTCQLWNSNNTTNQWDSNLLSQLIDRYEEPNDMNRWDSPLFPIYSPTDKFDDNLISKIVSIVDSSTTSNPRSVLKPNSVTKQTLQPSTTNFISILERQTTDIVNIIIARIKDLNEIGQSYHGQRIIIVPNEDIDQSIYIDLPLSGTVNLPVLQRLKRQFINLNKIRIIENDRIIHLFVDYLSKNLNK